MHASSGPCNNADNGSYVKLKGDCCTSCKITRTGYQGIETLYRTLRSYLVPQMRIPMVSLWFAPKHVIDEGYVEVELAGVFGLELACLKFDYRAA
jgi:hypothetical protein